MRAAAAGNMPLENREFRFDRAVLCCDPHEFALGCIPTTHLALRVNSPTHTTGVAHWASRDEGDRIALAVALPGRQPGVEPGILARRMPPMGLPVI